MRRIIFIAILLSNSLFAGDNYFCNSELESLPLLKDGRVKPLGVYSKEVLKFLTEKSKVNDLPPTVAFCLLSLKSLKLSTLDLEIPVHNDRAKKLLGIDKPTISGDTLIEQQTTLNLEFNQLQLKDAYYKSIEGLLSKSMALDNIQKGNEWVIFKDKNWTPLLSFLLNQQQSGNKSPIDEVLMQTKTEYIQAEGDHYLMELSFTKLHLFEMAALTIILSLFSLFIFKSQRIAFGLGILTIVLQIVAITFRVLISGRGPVTNMYETVVFSGTGALALGLILFFIKKEKMYLLGGLIYDLLSSFMILFANGMLDSSIKPLVPVLKDNFWLSTHVTSVTLSYGCFALSWVLANMMIFKRLRGSITSAEMAYNTKLVHLCIKVGVVLLAGGVILGGIWADYSWGRFWGWDPKETWSLIVLMIYMAILHGKMTTWINNEKFFFWVAAAFMSVMMAWFGVNYILASGLHSYGFSQGGAIFLGTFFAIQVGFLVISHLKITWKKA